MSHAKSLTYGLLLGAGMTYLMDPRQGRARRARVRDQSVRAVHELEDAASVGARDVSHRAQGVFARMRGADHAPASEQALLEHVRAVIGHVCSHPHAIRVESKGNGCVELVGSILEADVEGTLAAVSRIPGVEAIDDDLEVFSDPDDIPSLQGPPRSRKRGIHVPPAWKFAAGLASSSVALAAIVAGHPIGFVLGGAGALAIARNMSTRGSWTPVTRWGRSRRAADRARERSADAAV